MTAIIEPTHKYSTIDRIVVWLGRRWLWVISFLLGLFVIAPLLAPAFMAVGLSIPGKVIYMIYSFVCHQLPERSYFLFGPKISYTLSEIGAVWPDTGNIAILRQFTGSTQMGWKVAWSDRMVSMFTSLWLFGILWGVLKVKNKSLPWWGFTLLLLPMAIDGTTHLASDLSGFGQGFRDTNAWLAALTNHTMPAVFYAGDAWGSFNAWMRLVTGLLFGLGIVWFGFPYLNESFIGAANWVEYKHQYRDWYRMEKERLLKTAHFGGLDKDFHLVKINHDQTKM